MGRRSLLFAEGRDPSLLFDTDWYLATNSDVRESGLNPLVHRENNMVSNMMHVNLGSRRVELGKIPNYGLFQALACQLSLTA